LTSIDTRIGAWSAESSSILSNPVARTLRASEYLLRNYRNGSREISLFVAYYANQRAGETMHSPRHCLPGGGWEIWEYGTLPLRVNGGSVRVNQLSVQHGPQKYIVLYWYQSPSRIVANEYLGKILLVKDAVMRGSTSGSIVRLTMVDRPGALADGAAFASQLIPQIQRCYRSKM
jgi:EpsI family protein